MATFLSDRFDEASATALTAHTPNIGGAYSLTTGGGSQTVGAGTGAVVFDSGGTWYVADNAATPGSNVQTVTFDAQSGGAGNGVLQIWLRKTAGALTGYRLMAHGSVGMQIHQMTAGVETALVASNSVSYATNAVLDGTASISAAGLLTLDIPGLGTISGTNTAISDVGVIAFGSRDVQFNDLVATDDTAPPGDTTAPTITGPGAATGSTSSVSIAENTTAVHTFTADESVTWSLNGGADVARFSINSSTGALAFLAAPNFESPTDADTNNTYVVGVRATDAASNATTQTVTVTVTDAAESAPTATTFTFTMTGAVSLTGLKYAIFEGVTPDVWVAPILKGANETTDASGVCTVSVTGLTTKLVGQLGSAFVTNSDGSASGGAQSATRRAAYYVGVFS